MCCVQPVQGKGFGVIAQKDFKTGESILTEEVLLYCTRQEGCLSPNSFQAKQIYQQYNRLSPQNKYKVLKLFCLGDPTILNVFSTNSFSITPKYCGLYVKRINHSCEPNACYNNNSNGSFVKEVTALRRIKAGEEITISYISCNWEVLRVRREELSCWKFLCQCTVCSLRENELEENDRTRRTVSDMDKTITSFIEKIDRSLEYLFCNLDIDEETKRSLNADIYFNLKEMIQLGKQRIKVMKSLRNQLLLQNFSVHLDCLYLYLKARSLGITIGKRDDLDIDFFSEIVSTMSDWNVDWRNRFCQVLAKSFLFSVKWTYGI